MLRQYYFATRFRLLEGLPCGWNGVSKKDFGANLAAIFTKENQGYSIGFSRIAWGLHLAFVIRAGPLWSAED